MKNMKVSKKLIISFLVVAILAAIVGGVGILGMYRMNVADDGLYNGNYLPTVLAGNISQEVVNQRVLLRNFIVYDIDEDTEIFKKAESGLEASEKSMAQYLKDYDGTIILKEDRAAFDEFVEIYNNEWSPLFKTIHDLGAAKQADEAKEALTNAASAAERMDELTTLLQDINLTDGKNTVDGNTELFLTMTIVEIIVLVIAVAVALFFASYISRLISKPLSLMTNYLKKVSQTGNMTLSAEDNALIQESSKIRDEIGQCVNATAAFIARLLDIGKVQESIAGGDLTPELALLSTEDTMGRSLTKMMDNLNNMFREIHTSSAQVSTGSKQIADGAQSLAQGSTEQAAAVQQFSASISEIANKTKHNAQIAREAASLSETIKLNAETGSSQMENMMQAVREINDASTEIEKVIKVIDEIAFQTNILALNAAVEAARAGAAGKGFAVVAAEVRNLAAKSADAAKDTSGLIENSVSKANLGLNIATETSGSLRDIVEGINRSADIITQIAQSSDEQADAVAQVNIGIDQVAQVIQQNSATAQESAAASQEMSGQSDMLEHLISQFKLRGSEYGSTPSLMGSAKSYDAPPKKSTASVPAAYDGDSFGKY